MFDPQRGSAWLVKGHHDEDLRGHSAVFATLEQAILKHQHINFIYSSQRNTNKRYSLIEPYKLINHKGIWYLAAWDVDRLKSFSVSKLEALQAQPSHFMPRPQIDQELAASDGQAAIKFAGRFVCQVQNDTTCPRTGHQRKVAQMTPADDLKKIVKPLWQWIIFSIARVYAGSSGVALRNFTMVARWGWRFSALSSLTACWSNDTNSVPPSKSPSKLRASASHPGRGFLRLHKYLNAHAKPRCQQPCLE